MLYALALLLAPPVYVEAALAFDAGEGVTAATGAQDQGVDLGLTVGRALSEAVAIEVTGEVGRGFLRPASADPGPSGGGERTSTSGAVRWGGLAGVAFDGSWPAGPTAAIRGGYRGTHAQWRTRDARGTDTTHRFVVRPELGARFRTGFGFVDATFGLDLLIEGTTTVEPDDDLYADHGAPPEPGDVSRVWLGVSVGWGL